MSKTRILVYGDANAATGFSTVNMNILYGLHQTGNFEINVLGINHHGMPHNHPFPIWPVSVAGGAMGDRDPYGRRWVAQMMKAGGYDLLFTIQDSFILEFMQDTIRDIRNANPDVRWVNYFPVDGTPKESWIKAMSLADVPVTYTNWGKSVCESVCPSLKDRLRVIYHGVNTKDFYPVSKNEVQSFRSQYFGPMASKFIVTNVNRNQQRKDIPRTMQAFKKFKEKHPDAFLYLHCATVDHGWNLPEVAKTLGLEINKDISFPNGFGPNQGFPVDVLNLVYNAADVVVSSTLGEGWGLATTEAMACCKPVIVPDNTSCSEIVGADRGYLIKSGCNQEMFTILPNDNEVLRPLVSIDDMVEKLCYVYENRSEATKVALNGYKWVTSSLRWDKNIVPEWIKLFQDVVGSPSTVPVQKGGVDFMEV